MGIIIANQNASLKSRDRPCVCMFTFLCIGRAATCVMIARSTVYVVILKNDESDSSDDGTILSVVLFVISDLETIERQPPIGG